MYIVGYAYSGGGAKILRVDVSPDRGATWLQAEALQADAAPPQQHYAWTLWTARVPVTRAQQEVTHAYLFIKLHYITVFTKSLGSYT